MGYVKLNILYIYTTQYTLSVKYCVLILYLFKTFFPYLFARNNTTTCLVHMYVQKNSEVYKCCCKLKGWAAKNFRILPKCPQFGETILDNFTFISRIIEYQFFSSEAFLYCNLQRATS